MTDTTRTPMTHLNGTPALTPPELTGHQGVRYRVLEAVTDWRGVLVAVQRPRGRKVYLGRYYRDEWAGERVDIITGLGFAGRLEG